MNVLDFFLKKCKKALLFCFVFFKYVVIYNYNDIEEK